MREEIHNIVFGSKPVVSEMEAFVIREKKKSRKYAVKWSWIYASIVWGVLLILLGLNRDAIIKKEAADNAILRSEYENCRGLLTPFVQEGCSKADTMIAKECEGILGHSKNIDSLIKYYRK